MNSEDLARVAMAGVYTHSDVDFTAISIVLGTLLLCVALPLYLHYRTKWRAMQGASAGDPRAVQELWDTARRMEARIGYLEAVLDTEVPGWRSRSDVR
jgi:phage shock protein B